VYKIVVIFSSTYCFRGWPIKQCHSNLPRTLPGCHGNEIRDTMGYNSASAKDICEIVASIRGLSGLGHRMLLMKFYPDRPLLPWQRNLKQKGYNFFGFCKRYLQDRMRGFRGRAIEWGQSNSTTTDSCCHLNVTWPQTVKIVIVKYLWTDISIIDQL